MTNDSPVTPATLYGIPNCDTVKKARAFLAERAVPHEFHDFKKRGVPLDALDRWIDALGWQPLVNRQGTTWRKLGNAAKAGAVDAASAKALLLANPSLVKRPIVEWRGGRITVGFDPDAWLSLLSWTGAER